jgi:hypothetical protein
MLIIDLKNKHTKQLVGDEFSKDIVVIKGASPTFIASMEKMASSYGAYEEVGDKAKPSLKVPMKNIYAYDTSRIAHKLPESIFSQEQGDNFESVFEKLSSSLKPEKKVKVAKKSKITPKDMLGRLYDNLENILDQDSFVQDICGQVNRSPVLNVAGNKFTKLNAIICITSLAAFGTKTAFTTAAAMATLGDFDVKASADTVQRIFNQFEVLEFNNGSRPYLVTTEFKNLVIRTLGKPEFSDLV